MFKGVEEPIAKGLFVLQVDTSYFVEEGFVVYGCVIKEHDRKILLATGRAVKIIGLGP